MSALTELLIEAQEQHLPTHGPMNVLVQGCACGVLAPTENGVLRHVWHRAHVAAVLAERLGAVETVEYEVRCARHGTSCLCVVQLENTGRRRTGVTIPPLVGEWQAVSE